MLVVSLDSAVNVALPAMAKAFAIGPAEIRWVIICYVLTYAITSVAAGLVADRLGPVPVYTVGMWLSVVAFLLYFLVTEYPLARHAGAPGAGRWPRLRHITGAGHALAASRAAWPGPRHARGWPGGGRDRRAARRWRHRGLGLAVGLWLPGAAGAGRRSPGALAAAPYRGRRRVALATSTGVDGLAGHAGTDLGGAGELGAVLGVAPRPVLPRLPSGTVAAGGLLFVLAPFGAAVGGPVAGWLTDRIGRRLPM
jgi:MFS family permease